MLQLSEIELFGEPSPGLNNMRINVLAGPENPNQLKGTKQGISLYPNPVGARLYISGLNNNAHLEVYDNDGQRMKTALGMSISIAELIPGTYYLKVRSAQINHTYKFVKQ